MNRDIKVIRQRLIWLEELAIEMDNYIPEIKLRLSKQNVRDRQVSEMLKKLINARKEVSKQTQGLFKKIKEIENKNG